MFFSLFKTQGHSMEPKIKNGSFFLSSSLPFKFSNPKAGEIIVFRNDNKLIVKKITKIENNKYFLEGENKMDSKNFDPIDKKKILGKVLWIF